MQVWGICAFLVTKKMVIGVVVREGVYEMASLVSVGGAVPRVVVVV